jgi:hypothetical protein
VKYLLLTMIINFVSALILCGVYHVYATTGVDQQIAMLIKEQSPLLSYPTDFTRNIVPKAIHSHNDCKRGNVFLTLSDLVLDWREVPLLTALSYGVASVEADVWLINGTLFVSSLYLAGVKG